jgi:molybdenum cofactor cytidylyltransferase
MFKIGAIVLAAGMSRRMGQPKLLLSLKEKPLFRYALEQTIRTKLDPVVLVGGQHIINFQREAADLQGIVFLTNKHFSKGMSSSLKMGINQIKDQAEAFMIFLADQPFVPDFVIQSMLQRYYEEKENGTLIVRPQYDGALGHPILIDKSLFSEFLKLEGDQGGKEVLKKYPHETSILSFEHSYWGMDIDTLEDYQKGQDISRIVYEKSPS